MKKKIRKLPRKIRNPDSNWDPFILRRVWSELLNSGKFLSIASLTKSENIKYKLFFENFKREVFNDNIEVIIENFNKLSRIFEIIYFNLILHEGRNTIHQKYLLSMKIVGSDLIILPKNIFDEKIIRISPIYNSRTDLEFINETLFNTLDIFHKKIPESLVIRIVELFNQKVLRLSLNH